MSELTLSRIEINSDYKMTLLNGFIVSSQNLKKVCLIDNGLQDLEVLRDIHRNKTLTEMVICDQNFERQKIEYNKDGSRKNISQTEEQEGFKKTPPKDFTDIRSSISVEKFTISEGSMTTVKPLVQVLMSFGEAKKLVVTDIHLQKLHFYAIDNFVVQNDKL